MNEENLSRQAEEIEILKAIYNVNGEECICAKRTYGFQIIDIKIDANVIIKATLPANYPAEDGPMIEVIGRNIPEAERTRAIEHFQDLYATSEHDVILFSCVEWAREHLSAANHVEARATCVSDDTIQELYHAKDTMPVQLDSVPDWEAKIYHGETLVDRRSVFQAHVAVITHPDEATMVLSILKADRKIARATHNIMAYRVISADDSPAEPVVFADNDDDGEDGAGPKLAELLYLMGARNLIVVVSRWYGGIQLGPDRFKHIANVARTAIEHCGLSARGDTLGRAIKSSGRRKGSRFNK